MPESHVHRTNYSGAGASGKVAAAVNATNRTLNNMRGIGGLNIHPSRAGCDFVLTANSGFPWSLMCFGFTVGSGTVTLLGGEFQFGIVTHIVPDTVIPIATDLTYVGVWCTTTAAGVLSPGTDVSLFRSDADTFRRWLYQFRLIQGVVSLYRIGWGNIMIPGMGAPP